jgi:hypothetical protein
MHCHLHAPVLQPCRKRWRAGASGSGSTRGLWTGWEWCTNCVVDASCNGSWAVSSYSTSMLGCMEPRRCDSDVGAPSNFGLHTAVVPGLGCLCDRQSRIRSRMLITCIPDACHKYMNDGCKRKLLNKSVNASKSSHTAEMHCTCRCCCGADSFTMPSTSAHGCAAVKLCQAHQPVPGTTQQHHS